MSGSTEDRGVAVLLAVTAILAAILGARASFLGGEATTAWQQAVRQEVKRSAGALEDIRYAYSVVAADALRYAVARERAEAYRAAAGSATAGVRPLLEAEARVNERLVETIGGTLELADPKYARPDGGFDQVRFLVDQRNRAPDLVALDPHEAQRVGDRASRQAVGTIMATIPLGVTFLLGSLAQAFPRRRPLLIGLGVVGLVASVTVAVTAGART